MEFNLTKSHFSDAGFDVEEIYPGIFVVEGFLKDEEIAGLEAQFARMSEDDWSRQYTESLYEFIKTQYGVDTFEEANALGHNMNIDPKWVDKNSLIEDQNISASINSRLHKIYSGFEELELQGVGSIQRQYEGAALPYHVDSESNPLVVFANVLYINGDFNGGELHFPKIDVKFKPKRADLIIFPSADDYLHGVLPVESGPIRYVLPAFVNRKEEDQSDATDN